jgi:hypothetical protein
MTINRVTGVLALTGLLIVSGCGHPWFKNRWPWQEQPDPNQQPVLTNSAGQTHDPAIPSWVPLIDDCMNAGGSRGECIAALPPEELARLEAWETGQGAQRRSQMALRQALNPPAESRTLGAFHIDLPPGWLARAEQPGDAGLGDQLVVAHPAGIGSLRLRSMVAPDPVTHERLRNLTNVDTAITMQLETWGDYQGYQYGYLEGDTFFRQWWLARDNIIVLVSYQCPSEFKGLETEHINEVVRSLRSTAR